MAFPSTAHSPVGLFVRLFRGRSDAYGSWAGPRAVREQLTPEHFERHLTSDSEEDWIGTYNVIGQSCSWGCVDIDIDDLTLATNVRMALWRKDVPSWIEKTTRGYHVWVFPAGDLVDADTMRRALTAACHVIGYTPKEVFPKQTKVSAAGLGNWVRLPYNGWYSDQGHDSRRFIEHVDFIDHHPDAFVALLQRIDSDRAMPWDLENLAKLAPARQQGHVDIHLDRGLDVEPLVQSLGGVIQRLWRDGPRFGHDRSSTLARLAHECHDRDVGADDAFAIVVTADDRWGKGFLDRGEGGIEIIRRIIENAYG